MLVVILGTSELGDMKASIVQARYEYSLNFGAGKVKQGG